MTVLTAEIINPLSFLDYTDPEAEGEDLDALRERVAEVIARHGGAVIDSAHNELTAAFGAEQASEDHALQACRAALDIAAAVEAEADGAMRARVGIDTGEAVVRAGRAGTRPEVTGSPVTVSRRLVHALQRAVIATTGRAHDAAGGYVEMKRLGHDEAPSFPLDWRVFELLSERRAVSRWRLRASESRVSSSAATPRCACSAEAARSAEQGRDRSWRSSARRRARQVAGHA